MIPRSLSYSCKKVSNFVNTWTIGTNSMKFNFIEQIQFLLWKEDFYSWLNIEDINGADYTFGKKVCKDFKVKKLSWFAYWKQYIIVN